MYYALEAHIKPVFAYINNTRTLALHDYNRERCDI